MNTKIDLRLTWQNTTPTLLTLLYHGDEKGRRLAEHEIRKMAWLADNAFKPLEISLYPMLKEPSEDDTSLADHWDEVDHFDVDVRPEGSDPIFEYENLTFEEAQAKIEELSEQFPQAGINDLTELLEGRQPY